MWKAAAFIISSPGFRSKLSGWFNSQVFEFAQGFDEFMNVVIDEAAEVFVKDAKPRRELGMSSLLPPFHLSLYQTIYPYDLISASS